LVVFSFLGILSLQAQSPAVQWKKCVGGTGEERAKATKKTADGGCITVGFTNSPHGDVMDHHGDNDFFVVKLRATGALQWNKCFGGSGDDEATAVDTTTDGGYIIAGFTRSYDGDVTGSHGYYDYWIIKLDSLGNLIWERTYGGTGDDKANSIATTIDGGYIVAGLSNSKNGDVTGNHGGYDYWVIKLNSIGTIQWEQSFGGSGGDEATSIKQTTDCGYFLQQNYGYIIAGFSNSNDSDVTGNHGYYDYWVVKISSTGNIQWDKCLGGSGYDKATSIDQTTDCGYIVAGFAYAYMNSNDTEVTGGHGDDEYWVVKLNSSGTIQWTTCLGGSNYDRANSIATTTDGGFIVAGFAFSNDSDVTGNHGNADYWVVKLDSTGTIQWQTCLGGTGYDEATSVDVTADGGCIVAGFTKSYDLEVTGNNGYYDYWVVKLSPYIPHSGIETIEPLSALKIYPNPANTYVDISSQYPVDIYIYDAIGKMLIARKNITNEKISVYQLSSGIYLVEFQQDSRKEIKKLIIY